MSFRTMNLTCAGVIGESVPQKYEVHAGGQGGPRLIGHQISLRCLWYAQ